MISLKLHIRKEGTLLQNMQRFSCNLVGMSCPCKIRCFHKIVCNTSSSCDCTWPPPSRPSEHEDPPSRIMITYLLLLNRSGHSHCISFAIAESGWPIVSTGVWFGFRCYRASLTKFMTRLSKAVAWAFSSKSGFKPMLKTGFSNEMYSLLAMGWVSSSVYNLRGLLFLCHNFPSPRDDLTAVPLQQRHKLFWWRAGHWKNVCVITRQVRHSSLCSYLQILIASAFHPPSFSACRAKDTLVQWKESFAVVEEGLLSVLSTTAVVNFFFKAYWHSNPLVKIST